jgi:transcriptional regulator with XRE-family HTH domain
MIAKNEAPLTRSERVHAILAGRVSRRIHSHLEGTGKTMTQLAADVGTTTSAVSRWASAYTLPSTVELAFLANVLGLTIDELLLTQ